MNWLKSVAVDLFSVLLIGISIFMDVPVLVYVVYGYTALLLIARLSLLISSNLNRIAKPGKQGAPLWFYHIIYFVNTALLIYAGWWITSACWLLIWISAFATERKK